MATSAVLDWSPALFGLQAPENLLLVVQDPDVLRRGLSLVRQHEELGEVRSIGPVNRLSRTPIAPAFAAPPAGWHTRELIAVAGQRCRRRAPAGGYFARGPARRVAHEQRAPMTLATRCRVGMPEQAIGRFPLALEPFFKTC